MFRRDPSTNEISHYETYRPQTNHRDPKPWESVKRYDGFKPSEGQEPNSHFNKILKKEFYEPHVHDPNCPGGVRYPNIWEIPK